MGGGLNAYEPAMMLAVDADQVSSTVAQSPCEQTDQAAPEIHQSDLPQRSEILYELARYR